MFANCLKRAMIEIAALNTRRNLLRKKQFFFQKKAMHESLRKVGFVKFVVKGILLGYNATKKSRTGHGNDSGKNNCSLACATAKKKSNVVSM